jgi:hypothetical protein
VPLAGSNEHYTKAILQEEAELEEPVETSTDPIWTAKGGAAETLISISSSKNRGDVDKSSAWPKVASGGKEGAVATNSIYFNDGGNEGKREVDVDPYASTCITGCTTEATVGRKDGKSSLNLPQQ